MPLTRNDAVLETRDIQVPGPASKCCQFLERRVILLFWCVTLLYFGVTFVLASTRVLWNDELFTWYIAQRPSLADVWNALLTGAEQLPPLFYVITRASIALFGTNALSLRLPETVGFWIMSASLFWFVRSHVSGAYGLIAMLFPMVTDALFFGYEARPYGLMLGFSGLALLCWQRATESHMPAPWRAGLALSLGAAISCHYFAILCFPPFVLAECMLSVTRRRIDRWMWAALCAGLVPLIFFLPLLRAGRAYSSAFWSKAYWTMAYSIYKALLAPAPLALFAVLVLLAVYLGSRSRQRSVEKRLWASLPLHNLTMALGIACIPILGVILAKGLLGAFNYRYAIACVLGVSLVFTYSFWVLAERSVRAALIASMALAAFVFIRGVTEYRQVAGEAHARASLYTFLRSHASSELPLVISAPHLFFELSHEAAQAHDNTRFVFLADVPLAVQYTNTDDVERGLLNMRQWAPLDVRDFRQFCASNKQFLLFGHAQPFSWLPDELLKEGWSLTISARIGSQFLYRVTRTDPDRAALVHPIPAGRHRDVRFDEKLRGISNSHT